MPEFLPASYDLVWSLVALTQIALFVLALRAMWSRRARPGLSELLWVVAMWLLPVVVPVAYLMISRSGRGVPVHEGRAPLEQTSVS